MNARVASVPHSSSGRASGSGTQLRRSSPSCGRQRRPWPRAWNSLQASCVALPCSPYSLSSLPAARRTTRAAPPPAVSNSLSPPGPQPDSGVTPGERETDEAAEPTAVAAPEPPEDGTPAVSEARALADAEESADGERPSGDEGGAGGIQPAPEGEPAEAVPAVLEATFARLLEHSVPVGELADGQFIFSRVEYAIPGIVEDARLVLLIRPQDSRPSPSTNFAPPVSRSTSATPIPPSPSTIPPLPPSSSPPTSPATAVLTSPSSRASPARRRRSPAPSRTSVSAGRTSSPAPIASLSPRPSPSSGWTASASSSGPAAPSAMPRSWEARRAASGSKAGGRSSRTASHRQRNPDRATVDQKLLNRQV